MGKPNSGGTVVSGVMVYDFPYDEGLSLVSVMSSFGHGAISLLLGDWLPGPPTKRRR
jgi:hypothetical protein